MSRLNMVGLPMNTNSRSVSTEEALALVSDQTRRRFIRCLIESDGKAVDLDDVIRSLRRNHLNSTHASYTGSLHLKIELHHIHLPKLDEAGVVDYDARSATVRYHSTGNLEKLVSFIADEL